VAVGLVSALALASTAVTEASATTAPERRPAGHAERDTFTGLVVSPLAVPRPVLGADGRRHLLYELELVNATPSRVVLRRVTTLDVRTGKALSSMGQQEVRENLVPLGDGGGTPSLRPGAAGFLLMDTALSAFSPVPSNLVHVVRLAYRPALDLPTTERVGRTRVAVHETAVVVGRPLRAGPWIAVNGCCGASAHRMGIIPINGAFYAAERFAIDFVKLAPDGRVFHGDPRRLMSWPSYGEDVLSVSPGVVVRARDGIADNDPVGSLPPVSLSTVAGNHVVVALGGGRFVLYAHLQPGSLAVQVGDRVRAGQLLGVLGNSGNSDAPHLHLQVMGSPSPLASDGLPYRFRYFRSPGTLANPDEVLGGAPAEFAPQLSGTHTERLPLDLQGVRFTP
jgi:hypothetical protein